ncbi:unnamed protein product, partial [Meganyctiphanes norvegica]
RESTSHYKITHGGYNMHNVEQIRASWSMDQKQSEAVPHVEFQHPKAYASHYEASQGGDNTDDLPESGGSWPMYENQTEVAPEVGFQDYRPSDEAQYEDG